MRAWPLWLVLVGCTEPPRPAAPVPSRVDVPEWAEGTRGPATTVVASPPTAPTPLGSDARERLPSRGKRLDLDLVDADVANVCRLIGELAGVNVVVADGVTGKVTLRLHQVPWDEALDAVLLAKGYHAEHVGSVVVVRPKP